MQVRSLLADKGSLDAVESMHLVDTTLFYSPTSGGVKRYLSAKHAWLRANTSWQHTIVVPGEEDHFEPGEICTLAGPPVPGTFNYRLPLNPRRWTRMLTRLEPSLIEVGDAFTPAWTGWQVARARGIPVIAFYHSHLPEILGRRFGGKLTERIVCRYLRWLYERFDVVCAPSRLMCGFLNSIGVPHTMYQPLGVDAEIFHPKRRTNGLRAQLGLPPQSRLLVYAGRFAGEKNLPVLLQAFARLGYPYHLLMIGGDREARPTANVTMLPYRRDSLKLAQSLASADALVHAGTKETFGLVLLEAMSCGRPVVAARASSIPEFVDESVGLLAEPCNATSMADAIAALYDRDLDAVGATARERVLRRFTWQKAFQAQTAAYTSLVDGHRLPVEEEPIVELNS
jgi:alpha-1,6-mannosyltransferase